MAKGGKGRKGGGGGGGGGKTRKYSRDNKGRFAPTGTGATARGGRLLTAKGNKRKTQTIEAAGQKGVLAKPKGLKPQSARSLRTAIAVNRMRTINQKIGKGPDLAEINIKGRFTGQAGKRFEASIDRAVKQTKAAQTAALMKPKAQVRAERVTRAEANRAAQAAKPKRTRSAESLRTSRAKQIEKRRSITTNPAGERASAAAKMAANAARTQQRAIAFYKAGTKPARAAVKPAAVTKLGSRLNPAKKADRAATRKFNQAYERENRIRSSLFRGNKSLKTRQAITNELNKASYLTATMQVQRRAVRAQFDVQSKDKALRAAGSTRAGTISRNKDVRNAVNRREAFKRKVNRAGALSRPGNDRKAQRTAQVRAKAMATYQGARRPEISDSTVGRFGKSRTSTAFRAPASRLASPSKGARRQGRALALAQKPIRDQFGRRIGNPKKQQRSKRTGAAAMKFYQNPKAAAQSVLRDRGQRGLSTKGFRLPRPMR